MHSLTKSRRIRLTLILYLSAATYSRCPSGSVSASSGERLRIASSISFNISASSSSVVAKSSARISSHRAHACASAARSVTSRSLASSSSQSHSSLSHDSSKKHERNRSGSHIPHGSSPSVHTKVLCPIRGTSSSFIAASCLARACTTRSALNRCADSRTPPGLMASGASTASIDHMNCSFSICDLGELIAASTNLSSSIRSWTSSYSLTNSPSLGSGKNPYDVSSSAEVSWP